MYDGQWAITKAHLEQKEGGKEGEGMDRRQNVVRKVRGLCMSTHKDVFSPLNRIVWVIVPQIKSTQTSTAILISENVMACGPTVCGVLEFQGREEINCT